MGYVKLAPTSVARTPAEYAAGFQAMSANFRALKGRNPVVIPVKPAKRGGMGQVAANPYPGTFSDVNCPGYCFLVGNGLDTALFGNSCWPCGNVCASGTAWDPTSLTCTSAAGVAIAAAAAAAGVPVPGTAPAGCPGYCTWLPLASTLFSECAACNAATPGGSLLGNTGIPGWAWAAGAGLLLLVAVGGRR